MGFTILELLIASVLLSILVLSVWGSYAASARAVKRVEDRFDIFAERLRFRRIMQRVIGNMAPAPQNNRKANFEGKGRSLSFTSYRSPWPRPARVEKGEDGKQPPPVGETHFIRLDRSAQGKPFIMGHPYLFLTDKVRKKDMRKQVLDNVDTWEFRYWDGKRWSSSWNYSIKKRLPRAVEIKYTLDDGIRQLKDVLTVPVMLELDPSVPVTIPPPENVAPTQPGVPQQPQPAVPIPAASTLR